MPLTDREKELLAVARDQIGQGILPGAAPAWVRAGPGCRQACSLCGSTIEPKEIEYEVTGSGRVTGRFHFHTRCHVIWQLAATQVGKSSSVLGAGPSWRNFLDPPPANSRNGDRDRLGAPRTSIWRASVLDAGSSEGLGRIETVVPLWPQSTRCCLLRFPKPALQIAISGHPLRHLPVCPVRTDHASRPLQRTCCWASL
jgi:hypothetical protein